jgi:hypothetical protein
MPILLFLESSICEISKAAAVWKLEVAHQDGARSATMPGPFDWAVAFRRTNRKRVRSGNKTEPPGIFIPLKTQVRATHKIKGAKFQKRNLAMEMPPSRNHWGIIAKPTR